MIKRIAIALAVVASVAHAGEPIPIDQIRAGIEERCKKEYSGAYLKTCQFVQEDSYIKVMDGYGQSDEDNLVIRSCFIDYGEASADASLEKFNWSRILTCMKVRL